MTPLEPDDVAGTGIPAGVGAVRNPLRHLTDGDEWEVQIDGTGVLRDRHRAEQSR